MWITGLVPKTGTILNITILNSCMIFHRLESKFKATIDSLNRGSYLRGHFI